MDCLYLMIICFIVICGVFLFTAYMFNRYVVYIVSKQKQIDDNYKQILSLLDVIKEYNKYIDKITTSNKKVLTECKTILEDNTNALMSIPNYIPNKAEYNGQEIKLKHTIKK